jgi:DNA-binding transcriptional ArsR family regulator
MSAARLHQEWEAFMSLLLPAVASRLALAAMSANGAVCLPRDEMTVFVSGLLDRPLARASAAPIFRWDRKRFEVFSVLFDAWLRREQPVSVTDLLLRAGVSYPTARVTLDALEQLGFVERTSARAATLTGWPRRPLEELVPRLDEFRGSRLFADASGRGTSPESLLARLLTKRPEGALIGGVAAARHFWPGFDLNGTPRVDVTVPFQFDADWLSRVDPALRVVPSGAAVPAVLAVHRTHGLVPANAVWARASTVVFDVFALGLSSQAEDLIQHLRA